MELLENGKVIHTDVHAGVTGGQSKNKAYNLPVKKREPAMPNHTLRATVHSDGGTDSNGTVTLQQMPNPRKGAYSVVLEDPAALAFSASTIISLMVFSIVPPRRPLCLITPLWSIK